VTPRVSRRGNHAHASYWAFFVHRVSGLLLALFLPLHFWALAQALHGAAGLETFLRAVDRPIFKLAEWGLVLLLAAHAAGGVRLLLIEFGPWSGLRKDLIAAAAGFGVVASLAFALALFY
jgi:fumarate reductase subunit D